MGGSVELAVLGDTGLTERQKQSLLDVYASFLALNGAPERPTTTDHTGPAAGPPTEKESNMAKAKFDIKTEATRPLYAGVGVTDLAVETVREYVADVQKKVAGVQKDVEPSSTSSPRRRSRPTVERPRRRAQPRTPRPAAPRSRRASPSSRPRPRPSRPRCRPS